MTELADDLSTDFPVAKTTTEPCDERLKRLAEFLRQPRFQLYPRIAADLGIDAGTVQRVLQAVPRIVARIEADKREATKTFFEGEVQHLRSDRRGDSERHDSRVTRRRAHRDAVGRTVAVEL